VKQHKEPPKVKPILDGITGVLVLSMVIGFSLADWFYHQRLLSFWQG
ncbi:uncharacterized protein METZ01_LOCUS491228, partial [marine metagenome]